MTDELKDLGFVQDEAKVDHVVQNAAAAAVSATEPKHGSRFITIWIIILTVLVVLLTIAVPLWFHHEHQQTVSANRKADAAISQNSELKGALNTDVAAASQAFKQLQENGITPTGVKPVPTPSPEPGPSGAQGPGPSNDQVALAVASYCNANNNCTPNVSMAQVAAAVAQYCNANGQCAGPAGTTGSQGETGSTGAQGPGPTDAQVLSAVNSYCAANNCVGPTGATGPQGPTGNSGANAPTVTSISIDESTCVVTTSLSDGSSVTGALHGTLVCP